MESMTHYPFDDLTNQLFDLLTISTISTISTTSTIHNLIPLSYYPAANINE